MGKIVREYTIPQSARADGLACVVCLRELTSREEIDASRVGGLDFMKSQYEAVKRAICALDGKPASVADGEVDAFWERCGPKVRALLLKAYIRMSSATEAEDADFFASETVKVAA